MLSGEHRIEWIVDVIFLKTIGQESGSDNDDDRGHNGRGGGPYTSGGAGSSVEAYIGGGGSRNGGGTYIEGRTGSSSGGYTSGGSINTDCGDGYTSGWAGSSSSGWW